MKALPLFNSVNVVLLHGQQVCSHFGQLLTYWDSIVPDTEWPKFLFVLLSDTKPQLPPQLTKLSTSCFWLSDTNEVKAGPIIHEIMNRMAATPKVQLHCITSANGEEQIPTAVPASIITQVKTHFAVGHFSYLLYMMLEHDVAQRFEQTAMVKAMMATDPTAAYMITTVNQDGASQSAESVLHALDCEALANAAELRSLTSRLYSVGYSTLNANNSELSELHGDIINHRLVRAASAPFTPEEAWQLITDEHISSFMPASLRAPVNHWLDALLEKRVKLNLPSANERETARILSCIYQREPETVRESVNQFITLNAGTPQQMDKQAQELAAAIELSARRRLCTRLNAGIFPLHVLDSLVKELEDLAGERPRPTPVTLPEKTFAMRLNKKAYIAECCRVFEDARAMDVKQDLRVRLAAALARELRRLRPFVQSASAQLGRLQEECLPFARASRLSTKYPNYNTAINNAFAAQVMRIDEAIERNSAALTDPDGTPRPQAVEELRKQLSAILDSDLSPDYRGTFCRALARECANPGQLEGFFNQYLISGTRQFHSIHDTPVSPASLFLADRAFSANAWMDSKAVMMANNDNIERIDLYPLSLPMESFLCDEHSDYFTTATEDTDAQDGGLWTMLDGMAPMATLEEEPAVQPQAEAAPAGEENPCDVRIQRSGDKYVLTWKWKPGAGAATVQLYREGRLVTSMVVNPVHYNMPVGNVPAGVDVTEHLHSVGYMQVVIAYNGVPYANEKRVVGKQNKIFYHMDRDKKGNLRLTLEGNAGDISRAVLRCRTGEREVLYPLYATTAPQVYEGLSNASSMDFISSPLTDYPYVYAVPR